MKNRRQELALRSLSRVPPSSVEAADLHSFYLRYGQEETQVQDGSERVWMGDTITEKTLLMFPQERKCARLHASLPTFLTLLTLFLAYIKRYSVAISCGLRMKFVHSSPFLKDPDPDLIPHSSGSQILQCSREDLSASSRWIA
jgi:hypothetical protein